MVLVSQEWTAEAQKSTHNFEKVVEVTGTAGSVRFKKVTGAAQHPTRNVQHNRGLETIYIPFIEINYD